MSTTRYPGFRNARRAYWPSLLAVALLLASGAQAADTPVPIGVLAVREQIQAQWQPTANYLSQAIPGHRFRIVPLGLREMGPALERREIDFVITNPGSYVELEARHGVSRILTLRNLYRGRPITVFGSVIFTRADHRDIRELADLRGRSLMAVDREAFGGFLMAWRELLAHGVDPFRDLSQLSFIGLPQEPVVDAVRDGKVDVGIVRTDVLERLAEEGAIRLEDFRVLNAREVPDFPFLTSTRLYPEWPLARTRHVSDELAQRVAIALLELSPDSEPARASRSAGWTVPLDYSSVHEVYRELGVGPYAREGVDLEMLLREYWRWIVGIAAAVLLLGFGTIYVWRLNRVLSASQRELIKLTRQLEESNSILQQRSSIDGLTGVANRRVFDEAIEREWTRARRHGAWIAVLMVDIDHFKRHNDRYGHQAGDECLRQVAALLQGTARRSGDLVARYGGEEFSILLPDADAQGAAAVAERIRLAVAGIRLSYKSEAEDKHVTVSVGVAAMVPGRDGTPESLISAADQALYRAKAVGRNQVIVAAEASAG